MKYYYDYVGVGGEKKIGIHDGKNYIKIISPEIKTNPGGYKARYGKEKWIKDLKLFNSAKPKKLYGILENTMKKSELRKIIEEELLKESSNKEADQMVRQLIIKFKNRYYLSNSEEAVNLIVDSLNRLGWKVKIY